MRGWGTLVERTQTVDPCVGRGEADYPLGDTEMGLVQGSGIKTGGWRAFLDEVSQDLEDLRGVGDYGDDLHGFVTTRAVEGIRLIDFLDQAGPCGAALFSGYGQLGLRLLWWTDAEGWWGGWSRFQPSGARRTKWGWRDHPPGAQARLPGEACREPEYSL
jgi:hypothetical protein